MDQDTINLLLTKTNELVPQFKCIMVRQALLLILMALGGLAVLATISKRLDVYKAAPLPDEHLIKDYKFFGSFIAILGLGCLVQAGFYLTAFYFPQYAMLRDLLHH